jgi:hypothetical protein
MLETNVNVNVSEPRITKNLELSTAHISEATNNWLQGDEIPHLVVYEKKSYGFLILIPDREEVLTGIPDELLQILELGRNLECEWVMLDSTYDCVDGLQTFDW